MPDKIRLCAICGAKLIINRRQGRKKYCEKCKIKAQKQAQNRYFMKNRERLNARSSKYYNDHLKKPLRTIICERCGGDFKLGRGSSKVCIKCLEKGNVYERARAAVRRNYD